MLNHDARGARRLRRGRFSQSGQVYSVTMVTRDRVMCFRELAAVRVLISCLRQSDLDEWTSTLTFCVMPDHVHWLFSLGSVEDLSSVVRYFKGRSARRIDGLYWQRGFYDHAVRDDEGLRQIARYIVANPVRAGLVGWVGDYPHWDAAWL